MDFMVEENEAKRRPEFARALLDSLLDPCVVLAPVRGVDGDVIDFTWTDANPAACRYNGMSRDELVGRCLLELFPSHGPSGLFARYVEVVEHGGELELRDYSFPDGEGNGEFRWFDVHATAVAGRLVLSWRDRTVEHEQAVSLAESERRFRALADTTSDIVFETDHDGRVRWVSPAVAHLLGWKPADWLGKRVRDLVDPVDFERLMASRGRMMAELTEIDGEEFRVLSATGDRRWLALYARPVVEDGRAVAVVAGLRDVQSEVLARRAAAALSTGNAILVRARREDQLLMEMCQAVVDQAGYAFCWYGRPVTDAQKSVRPVAWSTARRSYLDEVTVSWGDGQLGQGPTGTCIRLGQPRVVDDFRSDPSYAPWADAAVRHGFRSSVSLPVFVDGLLDGALMVYAAEANAFGEAERAVLLDLTSQLGYGIARLRDGLRLAAALEEQRLLATAIDQAAEAIVVTDTGPSIRYVNPAALRLTGYRADEVIGQNPRVFQSGFHDPAFYEQMWKRLTGGQSWHGVLINRRKDGSLFEEDATITPVHDAAGERMAYVAVKHDLSEVRSLQQAVSRGRHERDEVIEVMRHVHPGATLAESAMSLCTSIAGMDGIVGAIVLAVQPDGTVVPLAADGELPPGGQFDHPYEFAGLDHLVNRSAAGAWWFDTELDDPVMQANPRLAATVRALEITACAFAPIRWDDGLIGVVGIASRTPAPADWVPGRLGLLTELGSFAGMLLGPQAVQHTSIAAKRAEVADVIAGARFRTVFEPVVDLVADRPIGYEALTRFDDDVAPDIRFGDANLVGMGSELEAACARAALVAAERLPAGVWVSVNFSPATIVDGHAAEVLAGATRPVVVEVTEHNEIENYAAVRNALRRCGDVKVAVDDAGAGFASLRHILELGPDIIKLDLALVSGIDTDPAKQALAAGMRHFASLTGTLLVAEGVESEAQARTIGNLGIHHAQGFLFDRHRP